MFHIPAHKNVQHPAGQADASNGPVPFDSFGLIIAYEQGEIDDHDELVAGFQALIDNGMAWTDAYRRHAARCGWCSAALARLIESGDCHQ